MQLKATVEDNILEMEIEDEDYAVAEILHHELLSDKHVVFAGVKPPHPLLKSLVMKVQTEGEDPLEAVTASCEKAVKNAEELLKAVEEAMPIDLSEEAGS